MSKYSKKRSLLSFPSIFKALGEPNRMAMFDWLCACRGECSVKKVSECCDLDLSVVSRHLAQLKSAGLVSSEKRGKEVLYSINGESLVQQLRDLADRIESCCCQKKPKEKS